YNDGQDDCGFQEGEAFRRNEPLPGGEERSCETTEHCANGKCRELGVAGVDPERTARNLILSQRLPSPANGKLAQTQRDDVGDQCQQEDDVVKIDEAMDRVVGEAEEGSESAIAATKFQTEESRFWNARDAVRTTRKLVPVEEHDADDFAKGKGNDRQIVAAQPQDGKAQHHAPHGGEKAGKRQGSPKADELKVGREQRERICAHCVEGYVAKVEEPCQTYDDVEPPAKHDI